MPKLGGILNISYGERPTTCLSSANVVNESPVRCPRCAAVPKWEILFRSLSAMRRGMPESAQLISWLYMARPTSRSEWVFRIAEHTPENVILQYNLESNGTKMQLGKPRKGGDYWLSYTGPSQDGRQKPEPHCPQKFRSAVPMKSRPSRLSPSPDFFTGNTGK